MIKYCDNTGQLNHGSSFIPVNKVLGEMGSVFTITEFSSDTGVHFDVEEAWCPSRYITRGDTFIMYECLDEHEKFLYMIGGLDALLGDNNDTFPSI